jgi:phosphatidylinositol alpha 1,6-mannosyltransferase
MSTSTLPLRRRFRFGSDAGRGGEGETALRIAIVAETFLPAVNGVTNSVVQVATHMRDRGHDVLIIAPRPGDAEFNGCPVVRVPSVELPKYRELHIGRPSRIIRSVLKDFRPDILHVAAPVVLGALALRAARKQGIPSVAIYQTDLPGFAERYGFGAWSATMWRWVVWTHEQADLTLAPSTAALWDLRHRGVTNVARWARGVDTERFGPRHRCESLASVARRAGQGARRLRGPTRQGEADRSPRAIARRPDGSARDRRGRACSRGTAAHAVGCDLHRVPERPGTRTARRLARHLRPHRPRRDVLPSRPGGARSGVPVVAPAAGGPLDLVQHGTNGYLWNPQSPVALVGGVHELANSTLLREQMGRAARASVESRTWTAIMTELEGHYRATVGGLAFAYGAVAR